MSSNRENALAAMLSRTLATLDELGPIIDCHDRVNTDGLERLKQEGAQLLSNWRSRLSAGHIQAAGLTDVGIVGTAGGWLIQFATDPMADSANCQGKVTLIRKDRNLPFSNMAVFFRLAPDICDMQRVCDPEGLAVMVALFASIVLETKGLDEWQPQMVIFTGINVAGVSETIPRAMVYVLPHLPA